MKRFAVLLSILWVVSAGLAPASRAQGTPAISQQLAQLIDRHLQAIGGADLVGKIQTAHLKIAGQTGPQLFQMEVFYRADGKLAFMVYGRHGLEARQVRDERGIWWRMDAASSRKLTQEKDLLDLYAMMVGLEPPVWLRLNDLFSHFQAGDREKMGGAEVNTFRAATRFGGVVKFGFDTATGLLVRVNDTAIEDYSTEFGILFPHQIRQENQILKVLKVNPNPRLEDTLFAPLPESNELVRKAETSNILYDERQMVSNRLGIVRVPAAVPLLPMPMLEWPTADPRVTNRAPLDLRAVDLTGLDLAGKQSDLLQADFDFKTQWPSSLPAEFNPRKIIQNGANPGLGIRQLQARGITGKGVGIALIDQALLVEHREYKDRLKLYEEHVRVESSASVSGCFMASLAAGKSAGVAPGASLYYWAGTYTMGSDGFAADADVDWLAATIDRVIEVNQWPVVEPKIRVIAIAVGCNPKSRAWPNYQKSIQRAQQAGIWVIANGADEATGFAFQGLERDPMAAPDDEKAYRVSQIKLDEGPASVNKNQTLPCLFAPASSRTVAHCTGTNDYVYTVKGSRVAAVPYLAGLYALACEVKPQLKPGEFMAAVLKTGRTITHSQAIGKSEPGIMINPSELISFLEKAKNP